MMGVMGNNPDQAGRYTGLNTDGIDFVGNFAAAVVALTGVTFGVFVRENRAHGFEHGFGDEVLRGDQLEAGGLALGFLA